MAWGYAHLEDKERRLFEEVTPHYSTDLNVAIKELWQDEWKMWRNCGHVWVIDDGNTENPLIQANDPALAICRAFILFKHEGKK